MMRVAILRKKYLSWETAITAPSNATKASSSISLEGMSRWFVGCTPHSTASAFLINDACKQGTNGAPVAGVPTFLLHEMRTK